MSHESIYYCGEADCDDAFCSHNSWVREAPLFYGINDTQCPINYLIELLRYANTFHASQDDFFTLILWFSCRGEFHEWLVCRTNGFIDSNDFIQKFINKYTSQICSECISNEDITLGHLENLALRYLAISERVEHEGIFWSNDAFETESPLTDHDSEVETGISSSPSPETFEVSSAEHTHIENVDSEVFDFSWLYEIPEKHSSFVVNHAFIPEVRIHVTSGFASSKVKAEKKCHKSKIFPPGILGKLGIHLERQKVNRFNHLSGIFALECSKFLQKSLFDFRLLHMPYESG